MSVDKLSLAFVRNHPRDAALALESLDTGELVDFLAGLPPRDAMHVLRQLTPQAATRCLTRLDAQVAAQAVNLMPTDFGAMLLRRLEDGTRHAVLDALPAGSATLLRGALRYSETVVGSIMDPDIPVVPDDAPVREVRKLVRQMGDRAPHTLFVVDENKHLIGIAEMKQLIAARETERMQTLRARPRFVLSARENLSELRDHDAWDHYDCIPVVDNKGLLIGGLTRDTLNRALGRSGAMTPQLDLAGLAFDFAEIFWTVCADMFSRPRGEDESSSSSP